MGNQQGKSKRRISRHSRRSSAGSLESLVLSADSLDLIYIDDYYDDARYLKLVKKRLAEREKNKKALQNARNNQRTTSDSAIRPRKRPSRPKALTREVPPSSKDTSPPKSIKTVTPKPRSAASKKAPATPKSAASPSASKKTVKIVVPKQPPTTQTLPLSSLSTSDLPPADSNTSNVSVVQEEKVVQTSSWHGDTTATTASTQNAANLQVSHGESLGYLDQGTQNSTLQTELVEDTSKSGTKLGQGKKPRSILTSSQHQDPVSESVRRQRSYVISSHPRQTFPQKSHSVTADWNRSSTDTQPLPRASQAPQNNETQNDETSAPAKKKLVVRGLKQFVNSHKRESSFSTGNGRPSVGGRGEGGGGGPAIWKREFPSKGKFHPDNFIYDWAEGPKAPPRPFSAMAKCKKHGGRCNDCGLFTVDLCQSCRKCETDCACPCPSNNPYSSKEAYHEIFGGDGWSKARKVLCNLTEKDKTYPVGGNASKRKQNCDENWAKNNFYKSQIDVMNPYNVPLTEATPPGLMPQPPMHHPMCFPPMLPMSFMPMMAMPPPMMHYYPPPPPCPLYCDPCCPYPIPESFMPNQNY